MLKDEIELTVNDDVIIQDESDDNYVYIYIYIYIYILEKQCISTTSHEVEIISYLNSNARELCIFNNYKIIKYIFIKYNCILTSSVPVQRMFSLATHINSSKRNRIGYKTFKYTLYTILTFIYLLYTYLIYYTSIYYHIYMVVLRGNMY